jgi:pimeloyl-ACP methyl ester carboxylesterase
MIDIASVSIPEVKVLKPLLSSDVNVYKVVYNTTILGEKTEASGLVCIPSLPGEYPVLSFQNGTNTLNTLAPSQVGIYNPYQLIEIIASMGYIVVIADYPGFGKSINVPHPYLVTDPTVRSLTDMFYAVNELADHELPGIKIKNDYYLLGYSQGGHATLALHKALELEYSDDFNLKGSACGAGPYDIYDLLNRIMNSSSYPMPVYLGYILKSYTSYNQFTNPVSDIFNEPYASRVNNLYNGLLSSDQINSQLSSSIPVLIKSDFLSGFSSSQKYLSVRQALIKNSISGWHSYKPLLLVHGSEDTQVNPASTENIYYSMIQAGTSASVCKKVIIPEADHSDALIPFMIQGIMFLNDLRLQN